MRPIVGVYFSTILNYISYVFFVQRCVCPRMYVVCNHAPSPSLLGAPDSRRTEAFSCRALGANILTDDPHTPLT
jgi:hypothetical protein